MSDTLCLASSFFFKTFLWRFQPFAFWSALVFLVAVRCQLTDAELACVLLFRFLSDDAQLA